MRRMQQRRVEEPLTITLDTIVETLLDHGYERMATLLRRIKEDKKTVGSVEAEWREKYLALLARLHKYEPPPPPTYDRYGKPGPMSDG